MYASRRFSAKRKKQNTLLHSNVERPENKHAQRRNSKLVAENSPLWGLQVSVSISPAKFSFTMARRHWPRSWKFFPRRSGILRGLRERSNTELRRDETGLARIGRGIATHIANRKREAPRFPWSSITYAVDIRPGTLTFPLSWLPSSR